MAQPHFRKLQFSCLSPEELVHGTNYSLTLNPCDARQYFDELNRYDMFVESLNKLCFDLHQYAHVQGYIEISKGGRLHLHGMINFHSRKTIFAFFLNHVKKLQNVCTYEIDTITDQSKWDTYCTKSNKLLKDVDNFVDSSKLERATVDPNRATFKPAKRNAPKPKMRGLYTYEHDEGDVFLQQNKKPIDDPDQHGMREEDQVK